MPRNKYPEETVQKILDVSLKLFLEKGFEETSVLDIVNNLGGLTRGAFYHHFKSKEEVLDALGDRMFLENNPFDKVKDEKGLSGLEKIRKVIKMQFLNEEQQQVNLMSVSALTSPKIFVNYLTSNQKIVAPYFEALIREGVADGSIQSIKYPEYLASLLVFISDIWLAPTIFPSTKEDIFKKLDFIGDVFEKLEIPILDDEIIMLITRFVNRLNIE